MSQFGMLSYYLKARSDITIVVRRGRRRCLSGASSGRRGASVSGSPAFVYQPALS